MGSKKPPLGAIPKTVWDVTRLEELSKVIGKYLEGGWKIPGEWVDEYNELVELYADPYPDWKGEEEDG